MAYHFSLRALEAFEAAARRGSFALAAEELGISPAAVSQLIRGLEDQAGRQLFERVKRGIRLSEAGRDAFPRLQAAFHDIRETSEMLQRRVTPSRIVISVPPSVATAWLPGKLSGFLKEERDLSLRVREDHDPVDLEAERVDLRLSYGPFPHPSAEIVSRLQDRVIAVCAPGYLENGELSAAQARNSGCRFISTDWGAKAARFPSWSDFLGEEASLPGHTVSSSHAAVSLACEGLGVALVQSLFAAGHLRENRLVRAGSRSLDLAQPYCLSARKASLQRPVLQRLAEHISKQMQRDLAEPAPV